MTDCHLTFDSFFLIDLTHGADGFISTFIKSDRTVVLCSARAQHVARDALPSAVCAACRVLKTIGRDVRQTRLLTK